MNYENETYPMAPELCVETVENFGGYRMERGPLTSSVLIQ